MLWHHRTETVLPLCTAASNLLEKICDGLSIIIHSQNIKDVRVDLNKKVEIMDGKKKEGIY